MKVFSRVIEVRGTPDMDVFDLTEQMNQFVSESNIETGVVHVFTPGSTAGVTTIEYESGAVADLKRALEMLAPRDGEYQHNLRWGDGNGYSHVRSALLGPSLTVPVEGGTPVLGTWQQVIVCDFDNRPRRRQVILQIMGTSEMD